MSRSDKGRTRWHGASRDGEGEPADGEGKAAGWNDDLMFINHFFKILIDE